MLCFIFLSLDSPTDTGGAEITKYNLEIDDGKNGAFREVYSGPNCEFSFDGLSPGHVYRLRVASVGDGGVSEVSWGRVFDGIPNSVIIAYWYTSAAHCGLHTPMSVSQKTLNYLLLNFYQSPSEINY